MKRLTLVLMAGLLLTSPALADMPTCQKALDWFQFPGGEVPSIEASP